MGATRVNHKYPISGFSYPDSVLLLKLGVDSKRKIRWKADSEFARRFKDFSGKKES